MAKLWNKSTDPHGKQRLAEVDLQKFIISEPTIIYLAGIATTDGRQDCIEDAIDNLTTLLRDKGGLVKMPRIYIWSHTSMSNIFNLCAYNLSPKKRYSPAAEQFARGIILPMVNDANGKALPLEDAKKNLRTLTLFGYSAGSIFAQEVYNASLKLMQDSGFKKEEAQLALQEIVLISTANTSRPTREPGRYTTLYLAAGNDIAVRIKNWLINPIRDAFMKYASPLKIRQISDTSILITAKFNGKKLWEWEIGPDGVKIRKNIKPLMPNWVPIPSNHEIEHYLTVDDEHNHFSRIVLNALLHAVGRTDKLDVKKLLDPSSPCTSEEKDAHREKIEKAKVQPRKKAK